MALSVGNDQLPDSPTMIKLKELDDKYLEIQKEFEKERSELAKRYTEKQKVFLTKRSEMLTAVTESPITFGTPSLPGFWCKAIQNHEAFEDKVKDWDVPVLQHLIDVEVEKFDPETTGFKVLFRFSENEHFSNKELSVEYHSSEGNPYLETMEVDKIVSSTIDWKPGMDVTVTKVAKKVKGGGAKKGKAKKEQEKPRDSFFRDFTQSMHKGMSLEELANILNEDVKNLQDIDKESDLMRMAMTLMENHFECGVALRDSVVPFAVRYYTGEACVDDGDSDDEDSESEDDADGDDSEDSDEADEIACDEAPQAKARGKKK